MQLYQGDCLARSFQVSPHCAALWSPLRCPVVGVHDLRRGTRVRALWRQQRLGTHWQRNVKGELCGTAQVLGNMEVWQRQGNHDRKQIRPHCVTNQIWNASHTPSHLTIPPDSVCPFSGKVVLQPPTKRLSRLRVDCTSPFPVPCNRRSCTDSSPPTATSLPSKTHPSARPVVSLSSQFYRVLWELWVLLPPPSNNTKGY